MIYNKNLIDNNISEMTSEILSMPSLKTPSFIYDKLAILRNLEILKSLSNKTDFNFTFSIKANALEELIKIIAPGVSGFSVSSINEALLCNEIINEIGSKKSIHITCPSITDDEFIQLKEICDYIAFNSINQALSFEKFATDNKVNYGIRVNPAISFIADERYDPCRQFSKLGVPIDIMREAWYEQKDRFNHISGLLFHSNSESIDFEELFVTVESIYEKLPGLFNKIEWLNMGGGYLFDLEDCPKWLNRISKLLHEKHSIDLIMEPGEFLVANSGYLVSTVTDMFYNSGKHIVILDTSVNHLPECFEYQYSPDVIGDHSENEFDYILAGSSCLAGDTFGEYCFSDKLEIGSKIIFYNVGAYSLVKANTFNGLSLPSIYIRETDKTLKLRSTYSYKNYQQIWRPDASI